MTKEEYPISQLNLSETAKSYLSETANWTKFLSIIGYIMAALTIVLGLFAGTVMSFLPDNDMETMPVASGFFFGLIYVIVGIIYMVPATYLFNFSKKVKLAFSLQSERELTLALSNQKSFFKFFGVMTIIVIGFYLIFGLFALFLLII